jgi:pyrroloquinoline quinone (PQQ) biosynthesis protein C
MRVYGQLLLTIAFALGLDLEQIMSSQTKQTLIPN